MTFREHLTKPVIISAIAVAALGVTGGYAGASALNSAPKTVSVCVNRSGQAVSLTSRNKCPSGTTSVKLNVQGATGATGPVGAPGVNGTNGKNGQDGDPGPGASSAVLDNKTTSLESSNVAGVTGADFFFKVDCQANGTAALRLVNNGASTPSAFSVRGTVTFDNSADSASTIAIGSGAASTTAGTSIVDYEVPLAATAFSGPLVTVVDKNGGKIKVSASLVLQEGPVGNVGVLNAISYVGTVSVSECNDAAEFVPTT